MIILVFVNVCLHVFGRDIAWITELAELSMVWVTFLGGACAARRGAQMTITEFIDKLDGSRRQAADAAVDLFAAAVLGMLVVVRHAPRPRGLGQRAHRAADPDDRAVPGMPVGAAATLVWVLWDLVRIARGDSRSAALGALENHARHRTLRRLLRAGALRRAAGVRAARNAIGAVLIAGLSHPLETIFLSFIGGVEPFILIAVPLFIFAGEILASGGVGKRIVDFARALLGFLPGGLGVVTVASCLMFGGVSGSAIADTAAIGSLVIPAMVQRGYSRGFAAALLAVAGTLALLMPLSIPFLVYAFISGVSMRQLSMAGIVPAIVAAIGLIAVCMWYGRRSGCDNGEGRLSAAEVWKATKAAGPALMMPVIIVGGIWSGVFTPTESAAVAVVYGLAVSLALYRDLRFADLPRLVVNAFQTSATVMLVLGATAALRGSSPPSRSRFSSRSGSRWSRASRGCSCCSSTSSLLVLGIFIEPLPALLLTAPLLLPLAKTFNIDLVHLGVVMTANLAIALYTPPVGGTLFVAARLASAGIGEITRALWPLLAASLVVLLIITYVPSLTAVVWKFAS